MEKESPLGYAVFHGKTSVVDFLLSRGADPGTRVEVFVTEYQDSLSLVSCAAFQSDLDVLDVLLAWGLDVEDPGYHIRPVIWAVKEDNNGMLRLFLRHGVAIGPGENVNDWPLYCALHYGSTEIVELLLEKGGCRRGDVGFTQSCMKLLTVVEVRILDVFYV
ncbi:ankyrin repeat-containing domain protein [Aspergillus aurantiobrunneus]